ncbi:MAG TPA: OmpH family outer membrane protein [Flavobacterium sp.]|nr:OmpH family outer membrane protein [Flavobacterium sp.]
MKQLKSLLIAALLLIAANHTMNAQAKTAHVDVAEVMSKMPAVIEGQKQLEKLNQTYAAEFKTLNDEYTAKLKKYDAESATVTEKINQDRAAEVQDMQKRLRDYAENAQKELQQKEADLFKPIEEKVKASIAKVGKAKGYQYVLNSAGLLLADGPNLTADVKKDLGF